VLLSADSDQPEGHGGFHFFGWIWLDLAGFGWIWLACAKKSGFTWFYPERAGWIPKT
jgi:hypothetical protein